MTPMLRSISMVNESVKRNNSNGIRGRNGIDHGGLEEHDDTCCRGECGKLGVWYSVTGKAYCDGHWRRYKQQDDVHNRNRANGLCMCGGELVTGKATCRPCMDRRDRIQGENMASGLCGCGHEKEMGKTKCSTCLATNRKAAKRYAERKRKVAYKEGL